MAYLWNSRATSIWSKYLYQGYCKKGKTQGPEDVHYVVHDVRARTLKKQKQFKNTNSIYSELQTQCLPNKKLVFFFKIRSGCVAQAGLSSWAQKVLLPQPPKKLGKWACATTNKWVKHLEVS
jgi:hypothetical protein